MVTSSTASWTKDDVTLRNSNKPGLTGDYSILKYADVIKDDVNVVGNTFEYRLEAQERGLETVSILKSACLFMNVFVRLCMVVCAFAYFE